MFRLLIVAVAENDGAPERWSPLPAAASAQRLAALFARFGATVEWVERFPAPTADDAHRALQDWFLVDDDPTNRFLYWVGHAAWENDALRLVTADSGPVLEDDLTSLSSATLANTLKADWRRRKVLGDHAPWTVVILDCCRGGRGVEHIVRQFSVEDTPRQLGLVGATGSDASSAGNLVAAFTGVLARTTYNDRRVPLRRLLNDLAECDDNGILADFSRLGVGAVLHNTEAGDAPLVSTQAATPVLTQVLSSLDSEARRHFLAKAQGAELV